MYGCVLCVVKRFKTFFPFFPSSKSWSLANRNIKEEEEEEEETNPEHIIRVKQANFKSISISDYANHLYE